MFFTSKHVTDIQLRSFVYTTLQNCELLYLRELCYFSTIIHVLSPIVVQTQLDKTQNMWQIQT